MSKMSKNSDQPRKRVKQAKPSAKIHHSPPPKSRSSSDSSTDQDTEPVGTALDDQAGECFENRLKILNLQPGSSCRHGADVDETSLAENQEPPNGVLSAHQSTHPVMPLGSLAQTLIQALNSGDSKLLETCFSKSDKALIFATVRRLPKPLVHKLIGHLVSCLNRRKRGAGDGATVPVVRRTKTLIEWVKQTLLVHMSYLLTMPDLVDQLFLLHASLQKRLVLHTKLLSLNGRLELVLSQIELNKSMVSSAPSIPNGNKVKASRKPDPKQEPYRYVEGQSSSSDQENGSSEPASEMDEDEALKLSASEEGSVEDVVLGTGSDDDESDTSGPNGEATPSKLQGSQADDLLDLEAEESESGLGEDEDENDDDEEEDDEDEDAEAMADFIDDGSEESNDEGDEDEDD